jgi:hypothetical protein
MTKPPLKTQPGGTDVRMRITSTAHGMRYVIKVSHNADVPLKIKTGPMIGSGQGLSTLQPGKTWRYEFGGLENRPQVNAFVDEVTFAFEDGRDVDLYHEIPCWTAFGLQRGSVGHKRQVSIQ